MPVFTMNRLVAMFNAQLIARLCGLVETCVQRNIDAVTTPPTWTNL